MRYRQLGRSGLSVSVVGLGCHSLGLVRDAERSRAVVHAAIEAGITFFDTSPGYGAHPGDSESLLGEVLKGHRQDAIIGTKVGSFTARSPHVAPGSRQSVRSGVENSLKRLQTDFIDLLYLHQPDDLTPIEETLAAMHELVVEGKVRYVGSANFAAWRIVEAELMARAGRVSRFIAAQNAYSIIDRVVELEVAPVCLKYGIGIAAYYPLANGLLTGTYGRGDVPPPGARLAARPGVLANVRALDDLDAVARFGRDHGLTLLQLALGGLAARPGVASVIAGASRPEQVVANARASDWIPSAADAAALGAISQPVKYVPLGSRTGHLR